MYQKKKKKNDLSVLTQAAVVEAAADTVLPLDFVPSCHFELVSSTKFTDQSVAEGAAAFVVGLNDMMNLYGTRYSVHCGARKPHARTYTFFYVSKSCSRIVQFNSVIIF